MSGWRQLQDGSWFNPMTGDLKGLDGSREAAGRAIAIRSGAIKPKAAANMSPPLPSQKMVVLPGAKGPEAIIDPKRDVLAVNPFELGLGEMSETTKKVMLVGGILGIAWLATRFMGKRKKV